MRKSIFILSATAAVITGIVACNSKGTDSKPTAQAGLDSAALVKRGDYLVNTMGCDDCHSPKRMGAHGPELIPELRLSGFPSKGQLPRPNVEEVKKGWTMLSPDLTSAVGPWGQSYAANITADETGIGNWQEKNFFTAMRMGKYKGLEGSRDLLPPMPWMMYKNLNDDDLRSIFYFLKTTKPVSNVVPAPRPLAEL